MDPKSSLGWQDGGQILIVTTRPSELDRATQKLVLVWYAHPFASQKAATRWAYLCTPTQGVNFGLTPGWYIKPYLRHKFQGLYKPHGQTFRQAQGRQFAHPTILSWLCFQYRGLDFWGDFCYYRYEHTDGEQKRIFRRFVFSAASIQIRDGPKTIFIGSA